MADSAPGFCTVQNSGASYECAPGRAASLQNWRTGFDSSRSCLRERYCRRGSTEKGAGLVNRLMLVRIQSSALGMIFVPMV